MPMGIFVTGAGDNIQILDNKVHHIETNFTGRDGGDAHGIAVYGTRAPQALTNIVIDGNEVYALKLGSSESLVVNGNVDGFQITNNVVHDNNNIGIDAIGFEGKAPDPAYDQARHGLIARNTVYNIDSYRNPAYGTDRNADGIYVDGGTHLVVERNVAHDCNIGIELASEHAGRSTSFITLRNNFVYHNTSVGIAIGGYDTRRGSTENCVIVNNTLFNNDYRQEGNGELLVQFDTRHNVIKNNIFYANSAERVDRQSLHAEHRQRGGLQPVLCAGRRGQQHMAVEECPYTGFAAYQAQTGQRCARPVRRSAVGEHQRVRSAPAGGLARDRSRRRRSAKQATRTSTVSRACKARPSTSARTKCVSYGKPGLRCGRRGRTERRFDSARRRHSRLRAGGADHRRCRR